MATDMILYSLHDGFANFRQMYHMGAMGKTLNELHAMLKTAEQNVLVEPRKDVLMVNKGKGFKKGPQKKQQSQGKGKTVVPPKGNTPKIKVAAEHDCFYCKAKGHWKRNCPKYLEDKKRGASASGTTK
ncbi:uncharacterized protein LOC109845422 [Asparagus officinalis]|nr:uncharacterized protein LOC109845422 [Asparagus officinalis]